MNARPNLRQHRRIRESSDDDRGTSCNHFYCARFIRGGRAVAFGAMGCRGVCFTLSADISSAESVMENISTVVLILLVAGVVVAGVACSGHRRWH